MLTTPPLQQKLTGKKFRAPLPPPPTRTCPLSKWATHRGPILSAEAYAVRNHGGRVRFNNWYLEDPPAEGTFKYVAYGLYTSGRRKGEMAVGKWLKRTPSSCRSYYDSDGKYAFVIARSLSEDVTLAQTALPIIAAFNRFVCKPMAYDKAVMLTIPDVWRVKNAASEHWRDTEIIIEPFIPMYTKFNSNTGWSDSKTEDGKLMQALSHFSYHFTGGEVLLCDLQGGYEKSNIVLTDPALMSSTSQFGPSDLGRRGIDKFFRRHSCNEYCSDAWIRPPTE